MRPMLSFMIASAFLLATPGCGDIVPADPDASSSEVDGSPRPVDADTRVDVLDQMNLISNGNLVCDPNQSVGQSFSVSAAGLITGIEVAAVRCQATENDIIRLSVSRENGPANNMVEITGAGLLGPGQCGVVPAPLDAGAVGPAFFDVRDLGLDLDPDDRYQFTLTCPRAGDFRIGTSNDAYPNGNGQANGNALTNSDLAFKIFVAR